MSVYTPVTREQLQAWLRQYEVGELQDMQGILAGIENTNYFVTTDRGRFVLTLFERLKTTQLDYYLNLMAYLAARGISCPNPMPDLRGCLLNELNGKPAALVTRLQGKPVLTPTPTHCEVVGEALARLHLAGQDFPGRLSNPRGVDWWRRVVPQLRPFIDEEQATMLAAEVEHQASIVPQRLPEGVVHADLFRDNVLFVEGTVGGIIDFYFAHSDVLIYDVAVTLNDWCVGPDSILESGRAGALLSGYQHVRALHMSERKCLPNMLRAGALRFWLSRLYDYHLPRPGELTHAHDPEQFRNILIRHMQSDPQFIESLF